MPGALCQTSRRKRNVVNKTENKSSKWLKYSKYLVFKVVTLVQKNKNKIKANGQSERLQILKVNN